MKTLVEWIATAGGLGYSRYAPGTWGSVPGLVLGVLVHLVFNYETPVFHVLAWTLAVLIFLLSYWVTASIEKHWRHDDSRIVIDEVLGQYCVLICFPLSWTTVILSFILFRFYDIWKPWPIRWVDRHWKHSLATIADDLLAALAAVLTLALVRHLF